MSATAGLIQSTISFLLVISSTITAQTCPSNTVCGPTLDVHFPFGIQTTQSQLETDHSLNCTYPGFNLSCQAIPNTTLLHLPTLHLPYAGNFTVQTINYLYQQLYISDPNDCLPSRMSRFNLTSSPFRTVGQLQNFVLLSCPNERVRTGFWTVTCLGNGSSTVIGLREGNEGNAPEGCVVMERVRVPSGWVDGGVNGLISGGGLWLQWDWPDCRACEAVDELCGFKGSAAGLEVGCLDSATNEGLSKTINYALGIGVPGILGIIVIICCTRCKKNFDTPHHHRHQTALEFSPVVAPQPHVVPAGRGLNQPNIERLPPKPREDGTCAICLSKYRPKEALRTLPECNHYFHAHCIDAWLKLNATCPVCRADTPDRSSSSSSQSRRPLRPQ